jgi:hypothetical protein
VLISFFRYWFYWFFEVIIRRDVFQEKIKFRNDADGFKKDAPIRTDN